MDDYGYGETRHEVVELHLTAGEALALARALTKLAEAAVTGGI